MRQVIMQTFRDENSVEHDADLEVVASEPTAGTAYDAPDPGWIESMSLRVDGVAVTDLNGWRWLIDQMLSKSSH